MAEDYSGAVGVADTPAAKALIDALLHTYGLLGELSGMNRSRVNIRGNNVETTLTHARNQHRAAAAEIILELAEQGFEIKPS